MNNSMISALVSMNSIQRKLDVIADNIANLDTVGYKQKQTSFEDTLTSVMQQPKDFQQQGRFSPLGYTTGYGVRTGDVTRDMTQGPMDQTNNPLDLAIEGSGMFAVEAYGNRAYTREGGFHFAPDPSEPGSMVLLNNQGYFVLNDKDEHIKVSDKAKVAIDSHGRVMVDENGTITAADTLKVLKPSREDALQQMDENLFVVPTSLTENQVFETPPTGGGIPQGTSIRSGYLEKSNVDYMSQITDMMQMQRAYQLAARAITSSDMMMNLANNMRG
ncbi:flagellar hook-basal body complex protein [Paenibacillus sp. HJL G12]|uniref:Flagellar hook-basal body complex protein n=1 Tax=Paenibacillus dendrobii TaxID=2691084 RepID=A0A7X3LIW8_9BACL|nr:flagellar hook-basal body protein [Paenibacillus dendrobii]MWV46582.1 flagellar hook-basal body complex protein [Paenibacillus dendrobii]